MGSVWIQSSSRSMMHALTMLLKAHWKGSMELFSLMGRLAQGKRLQWSGYIKINNYEGLSRALLIT